MARITVVVAAALGPLLAACGAPSERTTSSVAPPAQTAAVPSTTVPPKAAPSPAAAADPRPEAPDFTLRTLDGATFRLSEHRGVRPVVLNFWAPW